MQNPNTLPFQDPALQSLLQAPPPQGLPPAPGSVNLDSLIQGGGMAPSPQNPGTPTAQAPQSILSPLDTGTRDLYTPETQGPGDPFLQALQAAPAVQPLYPTKRPEYSKTPKPSRSLVKTICQNSEDLYTETLRRMGSDIAMYRQHTSGKPLGFLPSREREVRMAGISNLVNKLANMFSGTKVIAKAPYNTTDEEKASQRVEDAFYYIRKKMKQEYAKSSGGGNLQRDEYFYLLLHGRLVYRVLPDLEDPEFPLNVTLMDPATCFPTFGGSKNGLVTMVCKYKSTVGKVVSTYGGIDPKAQLKFAKKLGYSEYSDYSEYMNLEGDVIEYYDRWWRYIEFMGEEILPVTEHGYGFVPFTYVMATGEPAGMLTPAGGYVQDPIPGSWDGTYIRNVQSDMAEKGVSVFHYLKNTHRLKEALNTLLYNEVEKSGNPPTITYTAPHLIGKEHPPLDVKRGGSNVRIIGMHDVQGIPTSPRPTDISPLLNNLDSSWAEGTMPPGAFGSEMGPNASGIAIDTLLNAAKDLTLPYVEAWQNAQSGLMEQFLYHYRDRISQVLPMVYPSRKSASNDIVQLSVDDLNASGCYLEMRVTGIEDANEAQRVNTVNQAIQAGLYSQRYGMEKMNIENPDEMFQDILAEKAMQNDMMIQNVMIPSALAARGDEDMLDVWISTVVGPSLGAMQGGQAPGGPPSPGGDPLAGLTGGGTSGVNGGMAQQLGGALG